MKQYLFTKDRVFQGVYYRSGDIGVFPDDFTPPSDRTGSPICYPMGDAMYTAQNASDKSTTEAKRNKTEKVGG